MLIFQLKKMRSIKSANLLASEVPASVAVKETKLKATIELL